MADMRPTARRSPGRELTVATGGGGDAPVLAGAHFADYATRHTVNPVVVRLFSTMADGLRYSISPSMYCSAKIAQ